MMGTPHSFWREMHQSGRVARRPFHGLDGVERALAQIVAVHADEPLLGRTEDGRMMAAPAVRVAVLDILFGQ
jgi:hypothetical protein